MRCKADSAYNPWQPRTLASFSNSDAHCDSIGTQGLGVAGCFLDELHAGGEPEFGVDVREVGVHGPG